MKQQFGHGQQHCGELSRYVISLEYLKSINQCLHQKYLYQKIGLNITIFPRKKILTKTTITNGRFRTMDTVVILGIRNWFLFSISQSPLHTRTSNVLNKIELTSLLIIKTALQQQRVLLSFTTMLLLLSYTHALTEARHTSINRYTIINDLLLLYY